MADTLFIALIAGLGGMLGWGFADFFAKKTIDEIGDVTSLVWAHGIASTLLAGYLFYEYTAGSEGFPVGVEEWCIIGFFGLLQALVYIYVYRGFAKGQLAILNPVFSSYAGLAAILSIVLFNEVLSSQATAALAIVFAGILLISLDTSKKGLRALRLKRHPGLREIFIATLLAAFWTIFWAQFVAGKDWRIYASLMYIFMSLTIFIYAYLVRTSLRFRSASMWKYLIGIGIAEIVAYTSISYGFSETPHTSVIALLSGAFSLPVLLLSYFFLKERIDRVHRIGALVIIAGIAIISLT